MATRVDVEEIETTKSEKLLATVLAVFVLIGLLWGYLQRRRRARRADVPRPRSRHCPRRTARRWRGSERARSASASGAGPAAGRGGAGRWSTPRGVPHRLDEGARSRRWSAATRPPGALRGRRRRRARRDASGRAPGGARRQRRLAGPGAGGGALDEAARTTARELRSRARAGLGRSAGLWLLASLRRRSRYLPAALAAVAATALARVMGIDTWATTSSERAGCSAPIAGGDDAGGAGGCRHCPARARARVGAAMPSRHPGENAHARARRECRGAHGSARAGTRGVRGMSPRARPR